MKELDPETKARLLEWLAEPFDPDQVEWKPQTVNKGEAMAAAYAGPRAYTDRLNLLFGHDGWTEEYTVTHTMPGVRVLGFGEKRREEAYPGKVLVVCALTIFDFGSHRGTGECDAFDKNAFTAAEAQAFKRACSRFDLGRYLYDLGKAWYPYDGKKFQKMPELPEWAIPRRKCSDCGNVIGPVASRSGETISSIETAVRSFKMYGRELCMSCARKARESTKS